MKFKYTSLYAAVLTASLGVVGCSSSSGPSATDTNVTGRITGFGSVFVDGVEYETGAATVTKDGVPVSGDADLRIGMIVTLKGSASGKTGEALSIEFNDDIEGVVQANGLASGGSLIVMGQNVTVDANTNFESDDPNIVAVEDIPLDAVVEISGYPDGTGNILATFIELKAEHIDLYDSEMESKGVIADLDETAQTFMLGNMLVDYSGLTLDFTPANGLYVEAKFDDTLSATSIELEDDGKYGVKGEAGEDMDIEGMVTNIDPAAGTFELNGQTIQIPSGIDISQFAAGDLVSLEVEVGANGDLVAQKVEEDEANDDGNDIEVVVQVESVDPDTGVITTIDGQEISVDKFNTIMKDDSDLEVKYFSISDINANDWLEMKISENADGSFSAIKLERIDADNAREEMETKVRRDNDGALYAGDLNLSEALSGNTDALGIATSMVDSFAQNDDEVEVKAVVNPENDKLESLIMDLEGVIADTSGTVTVDGIDITNMTLPEGVTLDDIRAKAGQEVEIKLDLVAGTVTAMKSELSGTVTAFDATTRTATVDGVDVKLPVGLSLEVDQTVELELDAAGNVISMDIEHKSEMEDMNDDSPMEGDENALDSMLDDEIPSGQQGV